MLPFPGLCLITIHGFAVHSCMSSAVHLCDHKLTNIHENKLQRNNERLTEVCLYTDT